MLVKRQLRCGFKMMSQKNLDALMRGWAADAVFEFSGHTPVSGHHEGKPALEAFFRTVFGKMATMRFTTKRIAVSHPFALGLTNTALCKWTVDETSHDGVTIHVEGITVADIRQGRMLAARDYIFDTRPLEALWAHAEMAPAKAALAS